MTRTLDERVDRLEQSARRVGIMDVYQGTQFQRMSVSNEFLRGHAVLEYPSSDNGFVTVWCLSIGSIHGPKQFFYDLTMLGCVQQAEKFVLCFKKQRKS